MPFINIPINTGANRDADEVSLKGYNAQMFDCFIDTTGSVARWPGLTDFCDLELARCLGTF